MVLAVVSAIQVHFYPMYQKVLNCNSHCDSVHFFLPNQTLAVEVEDLLRKCGGSVTGHIGSAAISLTKYCKERQNQM